MAAAWAYLHEFNMASVTLRLVLAMVSGGMIGMERGRKRRAAGFRTYILVCLGAALTMLLSQYEFTMLSTRWSSVCGRISHASAHRSSMALVFSARAQFSSQDTSRSQA